MDFFGGQFTSKILGKGLGMMFGGDESSSVPQVQYNLPSYGQYNMSLYTPSAAGEADEIEINEYTTTLAMWNQRLFGNDSYTNITLPRVE